MAIALIALGCMTQVWLNLEGGGFAATLAKMTASSGFILLALASGALASGFGKVVLGGLVFSWFGDLFLAGGTADLFLAGLVSFLLGHVAYAVAFAIHGVRRHTVLKAFIATGIISTMTAVWLLGHVPAPMVVPVLVYILVITSMVAMSFGAGAAGGSLLMPFGAVMFYVSDLSVASGQFVRPDFPDYVWGLPLYFGGQALLALSVGTVHRTGLPARSA